jgi:hypothetical protein
MDMAGKMDTSGRKIIRWVKQNEVFVYQRQNDINIESISNVQLMTMGKFPCEFHVKGSYFHPRTTPARTSPRAKPIVTKRTIVNEASVQWFSPSYGVLIGGVRIAIELPHQKTVYCLRQKLMRRRRQKLYNKHDLEMRYYMYMST